MPSEQDAERVEHLKFADEFIGPIFDEKKTATVRYDSSLPSVGDNIEARTDVGREFAILEIKRVASANAVEVISILETFGASYGAETTDELLEGLNRHYDVGINPGTTVQVIVFEVVA